MLPVRFGVNHSVGKQMSLATTDPSAYLALQDPYLSTDLGRILEGTTLEISVDEHGGEFSVAC